MAKKKGSDTIRQQKFAREEFIKLKKMQQGELEPEPKPSEVYAAEMTFGEKMSNFWYHNKFSVIVVTIITVAIALLVVQCATKTKYDATIVLFTYSITGDVNCDKMEEYLEGHCLDTNGDGKVNVNVINCSIDGDNGNTDYNYTNRLKAQTQLQNANVLLYITDEESYEYLMSLSEKIDLFEGEPYKFGEEFYKVCKDPSGFYDLPEGLQISCRTIKGAAIEDDPNVYDYYDQAQTILRSLKFCED